MFPYLATSKFELKVITQITSNLQFVSNVNQFILFNSQGLLRVTCQDRLDAITNFVLYLALGVTPETDMDCSFNLPDAPIAISE